MGKIRVVFTTENGPGVLKTLKEHYPTGVWNNTDFVIPSSHDWTWKDTSFMDHLVELGLLVSWHYFRATPDIFTKDQLKKLFPERTD
jgi:hypothetical protein